MSYDERYQDGKNGPLKKEIRQRIAIFRTRGSTLADIGEALDLSGSFVSQLLNEARPGRVRSINIPRIIKALEAAERDWLEKHPGEKPQPAPKEPYRATETRAAKPRMFIASSTENLQLARDLQEALGDDVYATVWSQGVFTPSETTMESLIKQLPVIDFGAFVLAPDDVTRIHNASKRTVRDNVIFELGLFVGRLGRERCFLVVPKDVEDLHLPTDLLGVTAAKYDPRRPDNNQVASLGPACNQIGRAVRNLGPLPRPLP